MCELSQWLHVVNEPVPQQKRTEFFKQSDKNKVSVELSSGREGAMLVGRGEGRGEGSQESGDY